MFTGIIQSVGRVRGIQGTRLEIEGVRGPVNAGDSVAVNGACLTAASLSGRGARRRVRFDLSEETLCRTTLGGLRAGDPVNLETAARLGDPVGGHLVQGHVDGVGAVLSIVPQRGGRVLEFSFFAGFGKYLAPKGSVAVDGVSLTVVEKRTKSFTVAVIPFTDARTILGAKKPGDPVNLEADLLARYMEGLLK